MAINLDTVANSVPSSTELLETLAYEDLFEALHKKSIQGVDRALGQIGSEGLTSAKAYGVLIALLSSNWPQGYEKVALHFDFEGGGANKLREHCDHSLLEGFVQGCAFDMVEHLWDQFSKDQQEVCIKGHLSLGLAQVLIKKGQGEILTTLASERGIEEEAKINKLLKNAIELLDIAQKTGATREWADRVSGHKITLEQGYFVAQPVGSTEETVSADIKAAEGVIKALLDSAKPSVVGSFWESLCIVDNVELFKSLVKKGIINSSHTEIEESPKVFLENHNGSDARKVSNRWLSEVGGRKEWQPEAEKKHRFSMAELVCLFSRQSVGILGVCLADSAFREAFRGSDIAMHAFVASTKDRGVSGIALFEELEKQGVYLGGLVGDLGQNPLHMAIKNYYSENKINDLLRGLVKVCPQWVEGRSLKGETALETVQESRRSEVLSVIEESLMDRILKRRKVLHSDAKPLVRQSSKNRV